MEPGALGGWVGHLDLPLAIDTALAVLGVGVVVLAAIAYDAYRAYDGP